MGFFVFTIVQHTSNSLVSKMMSPLTEGKFLQFIGLWFLMVTVLGFWGVTKEFYKFFPHQFNFSTLMSKQRLNTINCALCFTSKTAPNYTNWIFEIRKMIQQWNKHMASVFCNCWIFCLEKSCPIGIACSHAQAGYFAQGSHIPSATSITPFVVQKVEF